jgi:hypothetical protein
MQRPMEKSKNVMWSDHMFYIVLITRPFELVWAEQQQSIEQNKM